MDLDVDDEAAGSGERQAEAAVAALCSDPPSSFALALDIGEARCSALPHVLPAGRRSIRAGLACLELLGELQQKPALSSYGHECSVLNMHLARV